MFKFSYISSLSSLIYEEDLYERKKALLFAPSLNGQYVLLLLLDLKFPYSVTILKLMELNFKAAEEVHAMDGLKVVSVYRNYVPCIR